MCVGYYYYLTEYAEAVNCWVRGPF